MSTGRRSSSKKIFFFCLARLFALSRTRCGEPTSELQEQITCNQYSCSACITSPTSHLRKGSEKRPSSRQQHAVHACHHHRRCRHSKMGSPSCCSKCHPTMTKTRRTTTTVCSIHCCRRRHCRHSVSDCAKHVDEILVRPLLLIDAYSPARIKGIVRQKPRRGDACTSQSRSICA